MKNTNIVNMVKEFSDLESWKEAHQLALYVYQLTKKFPNDELFGLVNQLKRASVSITSNISEGFGRYGYKDKLRFYYIASGSLSEVKNQLVLSRDLNFIDNAEYDFVINLANKSHRLLKELIRSTKRQITTPQLLVTRS
jgi:four helix bundle protein